MKDKPLLNTTTPVAENQTPLNGQYPEQAPKRFPSLLSLIESQGIKPKDMALFEAAFTHASYANEHRGITDYDRLEFLGDGVLDLVVGDLTYRIHPDFDSGKLSKLRSQIVEGKNLSSLAIAFGFAPFVRFSEGEKKNAAYHGHIFEDVFESFIGATYLDQGYDFVYKYIAKAMDPFVKGALAAGVPDWKSKLQEEIQAEFKGGVQYQLVSESGTAQDKTFVVVCKVDDVALGVGKGHNKKQAETEAAKEAYLARRRNL